MDQNENLVQNAMKNASFLMILQIFAKITTMSLNFIIARFVQKDIYGYSNIQLQLFYSMILFFSKESLRRACQREVKLNDYDKKVIHQSAQNMVIYCFPVQVIIAILLFVVVNMLYFQEQLQYFTLTLFIICLSAIIESLCEPFYVQQLLNMNLAYRIKSEGIAIFLKSILLYVFLKLDLKLLAFGLAQLSYCLALIIMYHYLFMKQEKLSIQQLWHKYYKIKTFQIQVKDKTLNQDVLQEHKNDLKEFSLVSVVKFVLTEGEKFIIFAFNQFVKKFEYIKQPLIQDLDVQAEFGLVSNLISIVCRFIFQPIEEMAFNLFSKFKSQNKENQQQELNKTQDPLYVLAKITQFLSIIGFCMIIFGVFFSKIFIKIVYTDKWATESIHQIMIAYCIYTLFMAINGVTEAFTYAKASSQVLRKLQQGLVLTSIIYIFASIMLSKALGIQGLIYGNCINMSLRIAMNMYFTFQQEALERKNFKQSDLICQFIRDYLHFDYKFIVNMIKNRRK